MINTRDHTKRKHNYERKKQMNTTVLLHNTETYTASRKKERDRQEKENNHCIQSEKKNQKFTVLIRSTGCT